MGFTYRDLNLNHNDKDVTGMLCTFLFDESLKLLKNGVFYAHNARKFGSQPIVEWLVCKSVEIEIQLFGTRLCEFAFQN